MPLSPPDPAQWTFLDTFTRAFLGPDYTAESNNSQPALIESGVLTLGATTVLANTLEHVTVTLAAARWQAPHAQVQVDHRWALAPNSPDTSFGPAFTLELVGATKTLQWRQAQQAQLLWGSVVLAALPVPYDRDTDYRTLLTVDQTQGRIQILRSGAGLVDVPLPADWASGMGAGGTLRIGHATAMTGSSNFARAVTRLDHLAVRSGDGTADLSAAPVSSGGVRLGGEWRFAPGLPDHAVGSDGDVWADTGGTGQIYQRQAGQYVPVTQLLGAPGPQGPAGPQGPQGPQGPAGQDGAGGGLSGAVAVPLLLGDATGEAGLPVEITDGPGGLAGYTLLGVDGPALTVEVGADSPAGFSWTPVTFPLALQAGLVLRLTRLDDTPGLSVLRAVVGQSGGGETPAGTPFTVQLDADGYQTIPEGEVTTDPDGFQIITNATATPDSDGFETVERSTP